jgi:chromosome segregation ATPase
VTAEPVLAELAAFRAHLGHVLDALAERSEHDRRLREQIQREQVERVRIDERIAADIEAMRRHAEQLEQRVERLDERLRAIPTGQFAPVAQREPVADDGSKAKKIAAVMAAIFAAVGAFFTGR